MEHEGKKITSKNNTYQVRELIGSGGFSDVYLGTTINSSDEKKDVAIKFLKIDPGLSRKQRKEVACMFSREAEIQKKISLSKSPYNKNIIFMHEFLEDEMAIVQEYVLGRPSDECPEFFYDMRFALDIFSLILMSVTYIHSCGIIHRDIKPANILIAKDDTISGSGYIPKLTDFGISKNVFSEKLTTGNTFKGTFAFSSPEQINHPEKVSFSTDIFSLGMTFFHLLSGGIDPFGRIFDNSKSMSELLKVFHMFKDNPPVRLVSLNSNVPDQLDIVIKKSIEIDCNDRYTTAFDFLDSINKIINSLPENRKSCSPVKIITITINDKKCVFEKEMISIGRSEDNDIIVTGDYVSSRHCTIQKTGAEIIFTDKSKNGSKVNSRIIHNEQLCIFNGDVITLPFDHALHVEIH